MGKTTGADFLALIEQLHTSTTNLERTVNALSRETATLKKEIMNLSNDLSTVKEEVNALKKDLNNTKSDNADDIRKMIIPTIMKDIDRLERRIQNIQTNQILILPPDQAEELINRIYPIKR